MLNRTSYADNFIDLIKYVLIKRDHFYELYIPTNYVGKYRSDDYQGDYISHPPPPHPHPHPFRLGGEGVAHEILKFPNMH